jgi:site-specific recombinase XerC
MRQRQWFYHGTKAWMRVLRSDKRSVRVSCETSDPATADEICEMRNALQNRGEFALIDGLADRAISPLALLTEYRRDPMLADAKKALDDIDLEPLVADWRAWLINNEIESVDTYVAQVRRLVVEGEAFPRSAFGKNAIRQHLDSLPVTGTTRNRNRAAIRQFSRWLVDRDILETNPVNDVRSARENDHRMRYLTPSEVRMHNAALPEPFNVLEAVMAGTGMEWSAIVRTISKRTGAERTPGLRRRDIDLTARTIKAIGGKNKWRRRTCHVTELWTWPILVDYATNFLPNALLFSEAVDFHKDVLGMHHAASQAVHLEYSTLHDHRHSYAYATLSRGMPPILVARQLGHQDASQVNKNYGDFIPRGHEYERYLSVEGGK